MKKKNDDFKSVRCEACGFIDIKRDIIITNGINMCKDCSKSARKK